MTQHTPVPLPLRIHEGMGVPGEIFYTVYDRVNNPLVTTYERAYAEYLVTACNMHEELVETVKLFAQIEQTISDIDANGEDTPHETAYAILNIVREALAKAGR